MPFKTLAGTPLQAITPKGMFDTFDTECPNVKHLASQKTGNFL
jgi:hypothetical protein